MLDSKFYRGKLYHVCLPHCIDPVLSIRAHKVDAQKMYWINQITSKFSVLIQVGSNYISNIYINITYVMFEIFKLVEMGNG